MFGATLTKSCRRGRNEVEREGNSTQAVRIGTRSQVAFAMRPVRGDRARAAMADESEVSAARP